ncbi:MAG: hypothetical protein JXE06_02140 [Coriobacteriia bacterium]|nr:hypothetical protein [Coriobacteriia bacterium]MBN2821657.1 hypothetical protein [Coriobacteriia bacterium]
MRLISWNCGGGFAKKAAYLDPLEPDVIVIPESAPPEKLGNALASYDYYEWVGDRTPHGKGLLVATHEPYTLTRLDAYNPVHRHILPRETS